MSAPYSKRVHSIRKKLSPLQKKLYCSPLLFVVLLAATITSLFNRQALALIYFQDRPLGIENTLFNVSAILLIFIIILLATIPFIVLNIPKTGGFLFLTIAAAASYFSSTFGIIIDETVTRSVFETTYGEATQYLNTNLITYNLGTAILFGACLYLVEVSPTSLGPRIMASLKILTASVIVLFTTTLFFYKDYAAFLRNNRQVRHMINPIGPLYEIGRYWKVRAFPKQSIFTPIGHEARRSETLSTRKKLTILVVGETARSDHFSINGYKKNNTNPFLSYQDVITFPNVTSCGTATAISVPCIFSDLGRSGFDNSSYESRGNLLDVIETAGYEVHWIDNNSGCQGVCERVNNVDMSKYKTPEICKSTTCYDEILLPAVKDVTDNTKDQFLIVHMLGSHGPSYHLRYPEKYTIFKPTCETSELSKCSQEEIINTYDNTILYTDFVVSSLIEYLKTLESTTDTSLIYVSDHGESLGENGIYLHSLPYILAPDEQKSVPLIFWFSEKLRGDKNISNLYHSRVNYCKLSHDHIFSTILDILGIETPEYKSQLDLLKTDTQLCRYQKIQ